MTAERGDISGTLVVAILLALITATAGGLVWYKHQPQSLPPALNNETGVMLLIPAGPFQQGPDKSDAVAPAFYIDRIEVTNSAWMRFSTATGRALPAGFPLDRPGDPVVNITIEDAATFAKWAEKRLPDALEWEKAYRGANGRLYPWGDQAEASRANMADNPSLTPHAVRPADSLIEGASPYNILQMAGNVSEFVRTTVPPSPSDIERMAKLLKAPAPPREAWYAVKGGSFIEPLESALPWKNTAVPSSYRSLTTGFRCAKDPPRR